MEESDDPTKAVCSKILLNIVVLQNIAQYSNAPKYCTTSLLPNKVLYHRLLYNSALWFKIFFSKCSTGSSIFVMRESNDPGTKNNKYIYIYKYSFTINILSLAIEVFHNFASPSM